MDISQILRITLMATHDDKIAETLNLTPQEPIKGEVVKAEPAKDDKLENDFQYARENLYLSLIHI